MNKKIASILLTACLIISVTACGSSGKNSDAVQSDETESTTETETSQTVQTTAEETVTEETVSETTETVKKTVEVRDAYYSTLTFEGYGDEYCRIPEIIISDTDTMLINSEIYTDFKVTIDFFEENGPVYPERINLEDSGLSDLDYEYFVSDDFISLVVIRSPQGWSGFMEEYRTSREIYNISIEDGHRLSKSEMLGLLGLSEDEFDELVRDAISAEWEDLMTEITGGYGSYADEMLDRNLSDEVIGGADVFVDPDGNICIKVRIETGAGSGFLQFVRSVGKFE